MPALSKSCEPCELSDRIRQADTVTRELVLQVISSACRRFPSLGQTEKTVRIERLIDLQAWTEAALALIDLELPLWHVRRIAYDQGEWYCALSRQRELPDWLDGAIEARHANLALAILSAFVEVQRIAAPTGRPSVPIVYGERNPAYEPLCCDNFD